jgi:hypothetical protein
VPLETTRRVSRSCRCPVCGRPDWCLVARDGRYAVCMRVESARAARGGAGGWVHLLRDAPALLCSAPTWTIPSGRPPSLASPERRHHAYARLQAAALLSEEHRCSLLARGYSVDEIVARGYRTLPPENRWKLARRCYDGELDMPHGVPGFFPAVGGDGPYWSLAGVPGLLIPCRSPSGQIRAYRVRPDHIGKDEGKYRWLSSGHKKGGQSSGVHAHVARPAEKELIDPDVWITEGEIKADLAATRLGAVVVSMPGVSSWATVLPDLTEILPNGGRVVVALDADWREKKAVHAAVRNACLACLALGFAVKVAQWDPTHKGLDDLLTASGKPEMRNPSDVPAEAWPLKVSARRLAAAPRVREPARLTMAAMRESLRRMIADVFSAASPCG